MAVGVIDALSAGFRLITRRWWIVLIPVILDVFLWMGPRIGIESVVRDVRSLRSVTSTAPLGQEYQQALALQEEWLQQIGQHANLFSLLVVGLPGLPSLMATINPPAAAQPLSRAVIQVSSAGQALLWGLAILLVGTVIASAYIVGIGRGVIADYAGPCHIPFVQHVVQIWLRVWLFMLGIMALLLSLGIPVALLVGLMAMLSPGAGLLVLNLLGILAFWLGLWVAIYLFFVVDAMVLHRVSVLRAIWNSVNVVLRNFWQTMGLIALIVLISLGMTQIWQRLAFAPLGTAVGIVGNAFVGSGLTAASLIFYQQRYARWQAIGSAAGMPALFRGYGGERHMEDKQDHSRKSNS